MSQPHYIEEMRQGSTKASILVEYKVGIECKRGEESILIDYEAIIGLQINARRRMNLKDELSCWCCEFLKNNSNGSTLQFPTSSLKNGENGTADKRLHFFSKNLSLCVSKPILQKNMFANKRKTKKEIEE